MQNLIKALWSANNAANNVIQAMTTRPGDPAQKAYASLAINALRGAIAELEKI